MPGPQRRSSDPGSSTNTSTHAAFRGEEKQGPQGTAKRQNHQRSYSVPRVTPPPPRGPPPRGPPPETPSTQRKSADIGTTDSVTLGNKPDKADVQARLSVGYTFAPDTKGDVEEGSARHGSGTDAVTDDSQAFSTATGSNAQGTPVVSTSLQGQRKDSLMLKPTPTAIARVKAAVERRRALEAEADASASCEDRR